MKTTYRIVNTSIKVITEILCRVDGEQLKNIPQSGPLILYSNHVNFLEIPLLASHLENRQFSVLAKTETWKNPILGILFNVWNGIPIRRGEADFAAYQQALEILKNKSILAVAPEGTRSGTGHLQKGLPGIVLLALRSGAPLMPIAHFGGEIFWGNIRKLKRTDFHIAVGNPFRVKSSSNDQHRETRQQITDEIMYQLAALLPPYYRGYYSDLNKATEDFLHFEPGVSSNLPIIARDKNSSPGYIPPIKAPAF